MFGRLRFLTAGESHGPKLTVILEGLPSQIELKSELINADLARRQQGFGRGGRMKIEKDVVRITSGIANGQTTGAPIALELDNRDYKNWKDKDIEPMTIPRPGHADLTGAIKYGHFDLRLSLERASARETAMRVCAGAVCKQMLSQFGILIGGYVTQIGQVKGGGQSARTADEVKASIDRALENEFAFCDLEKVSLVEEEIHACMKAKDTLGGIFEIVALNVPPGLGSYVHYDRKLEAQLAMALLSIPAMKGVEFDDAFKNATLRGTSVHDEIFLDGNELSRKTNRAAGFEGGVTTGSPIIAKVAMKPISTTLNPLQSVDLAAKKQDKTKYERSDFCAVPRAVPIGEAMMAVTLANALFEKLGGDSLDEMKERFKNLRKNDLSSVHLRNESWRFDYERT